MSDHGFALLVAIATPTAVAALHLLQWYDRRVADEVERDAMRRERGEAARSTSGFPCFEDLETAAFIGFGLLLAYAA